MQYNISIGPTKSFVGYPVNTVLGKIVDSLGVTTTEEKFAAVRNLEFLQNLKALEHFLGFAGSLRHNVPRYAMIIHIAFGDPQKTN